MQKALIQMNVQVHIALSDLSGVSGQATIRALLAGERDPMRRMAALRAKRVVAHWCPRMRTRCDRGLTRATMRNGGGRESLG
jgi:hypothetical protein